MNDLPDICERRHRWNPESQAANARVHRAKYELRTLVWNWFLMQGGAGGTCEQCSRELGMRYTTASARISELKRDRWLVAVVDVANGRTKRRKTTTGASAAVLRAQSEAERAGKIFPAVQMELLA